MVTIEAELTDEDWDCLEWLGRNAYKHKHTPEWVLKHVLPSWIRVSYAFATRETRRAEEREEREMPEQVWDDMRTAPRDHMQRSFQERRLQIAADCTQLKTDVDSYNDNHNPGEPIVLVFDFTNDVTEAELAGRMATTCSECGEPLQIVLPCANCGT